MRCIPATFKRVMHTPSPPIEVKLHDDHAEINYEFMDVHRRVPIKTGLAAKDAPYTVPQFPHLGRSAGRWEGDTLVIESTDLKAGLLDSLGDPGLWQSDQMQTVERFVPNGNRMQVIVTDDGPGQFPGTGDHDVQLPEASGRETAHVGLRARRSGLRPLQ